MLTVRAERPDVDQSREMVTAERPRGVFSRQLFLGENLDTDKIEANYHDGVLRLTIPVAEKAKPRRIEISHDDRAHRDQRLTAEIRALHRDHQRSPSGRGPCFAKLSCDD